MAVSANLRNPDEKLRVRLKNRVADGASSGGFLLDVDFSAGAGLTVFFGASGAGKTTILDCVAGLQKPNDGKVSVGGVVLFDSDKGIDVPSCRRSIGYLFQTLALFPHMTARQNIEYGLASLERDDRTLRVAEIAENFAILPVLDRRPAQISGGERQRVALARALVTRPRALLLDEPMTALDAVTKSKIIDDVRRWVAAHAVPVLYVTHDREEVYALGDRVVALEAGRIVVEGIPHDVLSRPQYESVAQLAGFENILDCRVMTHHLEQGTMTCRVGQSELVLEAPLTRLAEGAEVRLGIRAGDILLATEEPKGLSARNVIPGTTVSLQQRDVTVVAEVDCGVRLIVHVTPGACQGLSLAAGKPIWLVVKTYSCHVLQR